MNWIENELEVGYLSVLRCAYKQLVEQGVRSAYQSHGAHTSSLWIRQGHTFDHNQYREEFDTLRSSSKRQANYFAFVKPTPSKLLCVRQANVKQTTLRSSSKHQATVKFVYYALMLYVYACMYRGISPHDNLHMCI